MPATIDPVEVEKVTVAELLRFAKQLSLGSCLLLGGLLSGLLLSVFSLGVSTGRTTTRVLSDTDIPKPSLTLTLAPDVNPDRASFKVAVSGTVADAKQLYTYLVVDDGNAEWVEPGLGFNRDGPFFSTAYLGLETDERSLNKWYTIFAAVTDKEHKEYQHLISSAVRARGSPIRVYRTH